MYVRVNTVSGATDIDAGIAALRDKVVPALMDEKGFRGLTVAGNHSTGEVGILGFWETREDLDGSEGAVSQFRQETMEALGGSISVAVMEQVVNEIGDAPPAVGNPLRIVTVTMEPAASGRARRVLQGASTPGDQSHAWAPGGSQPHRPGHRGGNRRNDLGRRSLDASKRGR